ncbi:hypothetical protein RUM44_008918 [Polyplax serrata]|uniref:Uncharacterized protein n=1 Tax=Polyplax serrata TaxID=468196 RepID=A0ABR1AR74_POLSC
MKDSDERTQYVVRLLKDTFWFFILSVYYFCESIILFCVPRKFRAKSAAGEIVLVTGAGGGLGRLMALKFAKLGATVIVWDIKKDGVKDTIELITKYGGKAHGFICDLTNREEIYKTANSVKRTIGNVSILVNNAGIVFGKTLLDLPDEEIDTTFQVNILAHYWTTKAFLKEMMEKNHGHIVTVASVAGLLGTYRCTDYSATKFAAVGFHESLFTELKAHGYDGIQLTLICPYYINTGMFYGVKPRQFILYQTCSDH